MKNPYRIFSLTLVLLCSGFTVPSVYANNGNTVEVTGNGAGVPPDPTRAGNGSGFPPDPSRIGKGGGITASGSGNGFPPDPTVVKTTKQSICIQGFCLVIGL